MNEKMMNQPATKQDISVSENKVISIFRKDISEVKDKLNKEVSRLDNKIDLHMIQNKEEHDKLLLKKDFTNSKKKF